MLLPESRLEVTVPRRINNADFIFPEDQLWAGPLLISWTSSARLCVTEGGGAMENRIPSWQLVRNTEKPLEQVCPSCLRKPPFLPTLPDEPRGFRQRMQDCSWQFSNSLPCVGKQSVFPKRCLSALSTYLIWSISDNPDRNPYNCYFIVEETESQRGD